MFDELYAEALMPEVTRHNNSLFSCDCNKGLLGGITDAVGLTDHKGAEERQRQAEEAARLGIESSERLSEKQLELARENIDLQKEQLQFQRDQYAVWESTFGDISQNLGEYYENLSTERFTALGLGSVAKEYQQANKDISRTLAQRGLSGSGVEAAALTALEMGEAGARASVRTNAPEEVARRRQQFLGIGLGQGTQLLGIQAGQAGTVSSAFGQGISSLGQSAGLAVQGGLGLGNISSGYARGVQQSNAAMNRLLVETAGDIAGGFFSGGA